VYVVGDRVLFGPPSQGPGFLARFTPAGAVDRSFANGGIASTTIGAAAPDAEAVRLDPKGRVLIVGSVEQTAIGNQLVVERFSSAGRPDPGFGSAGETTITGASDPNTDERDDSLALEPNGEVLAASSENPSGRGPSHVVLLCPAGALDDAFAGSGQRTLIGDLPAALIQPDGKPVLAGTINTDPSGAQQSLIVVRLIGPPTSTRSRRPSRSHHRPALARLVRVRCRHPAHHARVLVCVVTLRLRSALQVTARMWHGRHLRWSRTTWLRRGTAHITVRLTNVPARIHNEILKLTFHGPHGTHATLYVALP
jgi:uncharacterized delta-60 repeat protein